MDFSGKTLDTKSPMRPLLVLLPLLALLLHPDIGAAKLCQDWGEAKAVGHLARKKVPEASGLTYSRRWPGHLYWVNDSGNKPELILSNHAGNNMKVIKVAGGKFRDAEALTSTTCDDGESCLVIADVGDNGRKRKQVELIVIREKDISGDEVAPYRRIKFQYSDGPHDVEAVAALPNGDLLMITKEHTLMRALPAQIYSLPRADWQNPRARDLTAKLLGTLPIDVWLPEKVFLASAITDAAVNQKRQVLGILLYSTMLEIPLTKLNDLSAASKWTKGKDFAIVPLQNLSQQETVAYPDKEDRVIWSSEWFGSETPIFSMTCLRAQP